ncbi:hypothetical protein I317_05960 [Kwoniella heveanensis CBS 569]|nr:hypothetical protein I317_05960 [Kwoniella heveanensis CBS 569]
MPSNHSHSSWRGLLPWSTDSRATHHQQPLSNRNTGATDSDDGQGQGEPCHFAQITLSEPDDVTLEDTVIVGDIASTGGDPATAQFTVPGAPSTGVSANVSIDTDATRAMPFPSALGQAQTKTRVFYAIDFNGRVTLIPEYGQDSQNLSPALGNFETKLLELVSERPWPEEQGMPPSVLAARRFKRLIGSFQDRSDSGTSLPPEMFIPTMSETVSALKHVRTGCPDDSWAPSLGVKTTVILETRGQELDNISIYVPPSGTVDTHRDSWQQAATVAQKLTRFQGTTDWKRTTLWEGPAETVVERGRDGHPDRQLDVRVIEVPSGALDDIDTVFSVGRKGPYKDYPTRGFSGMGSSTSIPSGVPREIQPTTSWSPLE